MPAFSTEIVPEQNLGGAMSFASLEIIEEASQTFAFGTPVSINSSDGGVQAWSGSSYTNAIAGISQVAANNLGTTGASAPQGFTPVLGPASVVGSYAANANQPLALIMPPGVPFTNGRIPFFVAGPGTVFSAVLGNAGSAAATSNAYVGTAGYGLTKDPVNAYWYVDISKTGGTAVLSITQLDPRFPVGTVGGRVWFTFLPAAIQVLG